MNFEALFTSKKDKVVRVGLMGAGDFGASLLGRSRHIPNMEIVVLCDKDTERMSAAVSACGMARDSVFMTRNIMDDDNPEFDVLVEATGHSEAAAEAAIWALDRKRHVVMASKEAAIVVGPMLHDLARRNGVVYTEVEGDQPSLLIGLVSWARVLGLEVLAAGKSSEYDFVLDDEDCLTWLGKQVPDSGLLDLWHSNGRDWRHLTEQRRELLARADIPTRTVPDFCEMGVVANATGLLPDRADFHAPLLRPTELADALQIMEGGGLFEGEGRIDVFNCLRRPDEASFAGGVFVIVRCDDARTWDLLRGKGHVVAANGKVAMLYNPQHLLGVEAPISILSAGLLGLPTGANAPRPAVDLVARATRDFRKGERLAITDPHHHEVAGLAPELIPARPISDDAPCPYYLAVDRLLREDVRKGELLTVRMVDLGEERPIVKLRRQQDDHFLHQ